MAEEKMDVAAVIDGLNRSLALQRRSVLRYSLAGASTTGAFAVAVADRYELFAAAELEDAGRLAAKAGRARRHALDGGRAPRVERGPRDDDRRIVEAEAETLAALRRVIVPAGDEPEGEALEHLLEHAIIRKQEQGDFLSRVRRGL